MVIDKRRRDDPTSSWCHMTMHWKYLRARRMSFIRGGWKEWKSQAQEYEARGDQILKILLWNLLLFHNRVVQPAVCGPCKMYVKQKRSNYVDYESLSPANSTRLALKISQIALKLKKALCNWNCSCFLQQLFKRFSCKTSQTSWIQRRLQGCREEFLSTFFRKSFQANLKKFHDFSLSRRC